MHRRHARREFDRPTGNDGDGKNNLSRAPRTRLAGLALATAAPTRPFPCLRRRRPAWLPLWSRARPTASGRAEDKAGSLSDWKEGQSFALDDDQENSPSVACPSGSWSKNTPTGAYGGAVKSASGSSAKARFIFTGSEVAWVSNKDKNRGKAEVWIDGEKEATVDLYSPSAEAPGGVRRGRAGPLALAHPGGEGAGGQERLLGRDEGGR